MMCWWVSCGGSDGCDPDFASVCTLLQVEINSVDFIDEVSKPPDQEGFGLPLTRCSTVVAGWELLHLYVQDVMSWQA